MKKEILTLTLCLALSAGCAFAATPSKTTHCTCKKAAVAAKNVVPVAAKTPCAVPAQPTLSPEQQARKNFEEKMARERENFYNALCLTPEQKIKAEALDLKNRAEAEPLIAKVHAEKAKLRDLKAKNACPCEVAKQKHELKLAKKAVKEHFKAADQCFKSLLTQDQLAKLETLQKERKAEFKKHHKHHCACPNCKCHKKHHYFWQKKCPKCQGETSAKPCPCETDKK